MGSKIIRELLVACCVVFLCGCGRRPQLETSDGENITAVLEEVPVTDADSDVNTDSDSDASGEKEDKICYIHVCGAVRYPGVYELVEGARLCEAIDMAGGFTEDACVDAVNLAFQVVDGSRVRIPTVEEWQNGNYTEMAESAAVNGLQDEGASEYLVNINTADESELVSLPGIGAARAEAIIAYREEHGSFSSIEEIQKVSGIKSGLYDKIKDKIKI